MPTKSISTLIDICNVTNIENYNNNFGFCGAQIIKNLRNNFFITS